VNVERLLPTDPLRPRWSSSSALVYFGAFVSLIATAALLAILGSDHGDWALVGYGVLATVIALGLAVRLEQSGRAVAAGVLATLAVVFFAIVLGSLENAIGIFDYQVDDYQPASLLLEALTVVAALVALRRFRAPLLVLPVALVVWVAIADLGSLFSWGGASELLSVLAGALLIAGGLAVDRAGLRPFAFWLHAVGGVAFGGGVISLVDGDGGWIVIGLLSLAYVGAAFGFGRSSYAVLGAFGILATTTYFIQDALSYAGFFVPIDLSGADSGRDPWQTALYYVAAGLFIFVLGLAGERYVRARDDES
jgi:hypothetical protein